MNSHKTLLPPFAMADSGHPADILDNAAAITSFLSDMAPHLSHDRNNSLSENGAHGLMLILDALQQTIEAAAQQL